VPLREFVTNKFSPDTAMPVGSFNPVTSGAITVAPDVVYLPTDPSGAGKGFVTKICPRVVAGMAQSANNKEALRIENVAAFWMVTLGITNSLGRLFKMRLVE
jgi:hypothetical protein